MSNSKKSLSVMLGAATLLWSLGFAGVSAVHAQTTDLNALIASLQAQIAALKSQLPSGTTTSANFSRNLTVGSTGADVTALQNILKSHGFMTANATGFFGSLTRAAVKAWQASVGLPSTGFFGPMSRLALNSVSTTPTTPGVTPIPVGTGFSVSLDASNPPAGNFPVGAATVPVLKLDFANGTGGAITVNALNVYRGGISSDSDLSNVYIMDGAKVLAQNQGIATGKIMFTQAGGLFTVPAGSTKVITVAVDFATGAGASHTYSFSLNSANDINSFDANNTSVAEAGSFPISGNSMMSVAVSSPALASVSLNGLTTGTSANAGTAGYLAGQFTVQSNNSTVQLRSIKLTEVGTINASTDLANIKLMNGATQVGSAVGLNPDGTVIFDLSSNPLVVPSGQTLTLSLFADIVGGVNRNFKFSIQHTYDVVGLDTTYNVGATVLNNNAAFSVINLSQVNVQTGTLTQSKDVNSLVNVIPPGSTNQAVGSFDFKATGEAVRITAINYQIAYPSAAETAVWNNLKLVDDQGVQIGTTATAGATVATSKVISATGLNYVIPANTTRVISVRADIVSTFTGAITAQINATTNGAQGVTSLNTFNITQITGNALSASSAALSASLNSVLGTVTTVAGAAQQRVASFALTAGVAEGVNLSTVQVTTQNTSTVATAFQNLFIKVNGSVFGTTQTTLVANTPYTFSASSPIQIAAGQSAIVDVYADTVSGQVMPSSPVANLTAVSATGLVSNSVKNITPSSVNGQNVVLNSAGTLTLSAPSTQVASQQVAMGVTSVKVASFKLAADNNENLIPTQITLRDTKNPTSTGNEFVNIRLMNGQNQVGSAFPQGFTGFGANTSTTLTFSLPSTGAGSLLVPMNGNVQLDVLADINTFTNGAASNSTNTVDLVSAVYQGASSALSSSSATNVVSGAVISVFRSSLNAAPVAVSPTPTNAPVDQVVANFNFTAGPNDDAIVKSVTIQQVGGAVSSTGAVTLQLYDLSNPSVFLTTATSTTNATTTVLNGASGWTIPKGTTRTLAIKALLGTAAITTNATPKTYGINLNSWSWSDVTTGAIVANPIIQFPIAAPSILF